MRYFKILSDKDTKVRGLVFMALTLTLDNSYSMLFFLLMVFCFIAGHPELVEGCHYELSLQ